jgi:hypothetical protein
MILNYLPDVTRVSYVFITFNGIFKNHTKSIFLKQKVHEMKLMRQK